MAMAKGRLGDYYLANPIAHLNGLTARLIDLVADLRTGRECGVTRGDVERVHVKTSTFEKRPGTEKPQVLGEKGLSAAEKACSYML